MRPMGEIFSHQNVEIHIPPSDRRHAFDMNNFSDYYRKDLNALGNFYQTYFVNEVRVRLFVVEFGKMVLLHISFKWAMKRFRIVDFIDFIASI